MQFQLLLSYPLCVGCIVVLMVRKRERTVVRGGVDEWGMNEGEGEREMETVGSSCIERRGERERKRAMVFSSSFLLIKETKNKSFFFIFLYLTIKKIRFF